MLTHEAIAEYEQMRGFLWMLGGYFFSAMKFNHHHLVSDYENQLAEHFRRTHNLDPLIGVAQQIADWRWSQAHATK